MNWRFETQAPQIATRYEWTRFRRILDVGGGDGTVLHDWDDDHARTILTRCSEAAGVTGTVVLIESIRGQDTGTGFDLFMLMCFAGRERTVDELAALGAASGLRLRRHAAVADGRTALEFSTV